MSELIGSREHRQKIMKELIMELHAGKSAAEVKERFARLIAGVSPAEISKLEQSLIMEGMPVSEVQRLCDVHAAVFKGAIEPAGRPGEVPPGHPVHTFKKENEAITALLDGRLKPHLAALAREDTPEARRLLVEDLDLLGQIDKHYSRKENLLFPHLERYGVTAPPKVMWGVDDEIRDALKRTRGMLADPGAPDAKAATAAIESMADRVREMISKEETILLPMALGTLTEADWARIAADSPEIGYCLIEPDGGMPAAPADGAAGGAAQGAKDRDGIDLPTGSLTIRQLAAILDRLPVDLTFIDADDTVRYFSRNPERVFVRPPSIIGRRVQNCHPPASVQVVEGLLADLKSGRKDCEAFWLRLGERYVYIRYFAVRDEGGAYLGTLEVTQDIAPIQEIHGEKRLVSEAGTQ